MKKILAITIMAGVLYSFSAACTWANNADDIKWIATCMDDNKDEGQSAEVVRKYCECMNSKMEDDESQTITQWEKFHPQEREQCSKRAGWK